MRPLRLQLHDLPPVGAALLGLAGLCIGQILCDHVHALPLGAQSLATDIQAAEHTVKVHGVPRMLF